MVKEREKGLLQKHVALNFWTELSIISVGFPSSVYSLAALRQNFYLFLILMLAQISIEVFLLFIFFGDFEIWLTASFFLHVRQVHLFFFFEFIGFLIFFKAIIKEGIAIDLS